MGPVKRIAHEPGYRGGGGDYLISLPSLFCLPAQLTALVGFRTSIADIATWPWIIRMLPSLSVAFTDYPLLARWFDTIAERPAAERAEQCCSRLSSSVAPPRDEADINHFFVCKTWPHIGYGMLKFRAKARRLFSSDKIIL